MAEPTTSPAFEVRDGTLCLGQVGPISGCVRVAAVGDIQLSASIAQTIVQHGPAWPFGDTLEVLHAADIRLGHLEFLFSRQFEAAMPGSEPFTGAREESADALLEAKFDVLSVASNHAMDWGAEAIGATRAILERRNIAFAGAGLDIEEAVRPALLDCGGLRIGFLAFCKRGAFSAGRRQPGAAPIDREVLLEAVGRCKALADIVIVSLHWGMEFCPYPRPGDRRLAHELIEAGASAIVGHHPHVVQGIEIYRGAPIFYSLGSFLYNPLDERIREEKNLERRRLSMVAVVALAREGIAGVRIVPTRFGEDGRLHVLVGDDAKRACDYILQLSQRIDQRGLAFCEQAVGSILAREIRTIGLLWKRGGVRALLALAKDVRLRHIGLLVGFVLAKICKLAGLRKRTPSAGQGGR